MNDLQKEKIRNTIIAFIGVPTMLVIIASISYSLGSFLSKESTQYQAIFDIISTVFMVLILLLVILWVLFLLIYSWVEDFVLRGISPLVDYEDMRSCLKFLGDYDVKDYSYYSRLRYCRLEKLFLGKLYIFLKDYNEDPLVEYDKQLMKVQKRRINY